MELNLIVINSSYRFLLSTITKLESQAVPLTDSVARVFYWQDKNYMKLLVMLKEYISPSFEEKWWILFIYTYGECLLMEGNNNLTNRFTLL